MHTPVSSFKQKGNVCLEERNVSGIARESVNPGQCVKVTSKLCREREIKRTFVCFLTTVWVKRAKNTVGN